MSKPTERDPLPPQVRALGEPFAIFRGSRLLSVVCFIIGPLTSLVFVGVAIATLTTGGIKEDSPARPIAVGMAVLMTLGGAYLTYTGFAVRKLRYLLCPGGIARVKGTRVTVLPWEGLQVFAQFHGQPLLTMLGSSNRYWFKNGSSKWKVGDDVAGLDNLVKAVSEEVVRRELDSGVKRLERGEGLVFGPISIDRNGIKLKDRSLPWRQVSSVGDVVKPVPGGRGRYFTIKQAGSDREWGSVEDRKVPNFELLFALIRKMHPAALAR